MRVLRFLLVVLVVGGLWAGVPVWGGEGPAAPTLANPNHAEPAPPPCEQAPPPGDGPHDFTGEFSPSDEPQWADPATGDLSPLVIAPSARSSGTFVHERRTVRTSERMAEIWVSLPKGAQSSVSVNFVEYPPEGEFRIFRTKLNSQETRRFYLSAKRWDAPTNGWIELSGKRFDEEGNDISDLVPCPPLPGQEAPTSSYVDLQPGQRAIVHFDDPHGCQIVAAAPIPACDMDAAIKKHLGPLESQLIAMQADLTTTKGALATQGTTLGTLNMTAGEIKGQVASMQTQLKHAAAPHDQSAKVTQWFQFDNSTKTFSGDFASDVNGKLIVNWPDLPASVVIKVPNRISPMPPRPFTANVTFMIREGKQKPTFEQMIAVTFNDNGDQIVAVIPFHQSLAGPLKTALLNKIKTTGTFRIIATIDYHATLGELGPVHVAGPLGNEIDLTITP